METEIRGTEERLTARRLQLYPTTHNTRNRQTSMPQALFEPAIQAIELSHNHVDGHWVRRMFALENLLLNWE
jgi:hypothetical protein